MDASLIKFQILPLNRGASATVAGVKVTRMSANLYKIDGEQGGRFGIDNTVTAIQQIIASR